MLESKELGMLNPNNDLSYYAIHCPAPVKNRDFVLQVAFWNLMILFTAVSTDFLPHDQISHYSSVVNLSHLIS